MVLDGTGSYGRASPLGDGGSPRPARTSCPHGSLAALRISHPDRPSERSTPDAERSCWAPANRLRPRPGTWPGSHRRSPVPRCCGRCVTRTRPGTLFPTTRLHARCAPGCPFCSRLRRAGVTTTEHNPWEDRDAAARVQEATGDETVPVVVVGDRSMVNPSTSEVTDAARLAAPDDVDLLEGASRQGRSRGAAASWTLLLVVLWAARAPWRPTTTWHLIPLLVGGGAAWIASSSTGCARAR